MTRRMVRFADNRVLQSDCDPVEVYCDASLDEGAVMMATFDASPLSSGREFFVGVEQHEAELLLELLADTADEDLEALRHRLERTLEHMSVVS